MLQPASPRPTCSRSNNSTLPRRSGGGVKDQKEDRKEPVRYHPSLWAACAICGPQPSQQVFIRLQWQICAIEGEPHSPRLSARRNSRVLIRKCLWFGEARFNDIIDVQALVSISACFECHEKNFRGPPVVALPSILRPQQLLNRNWLDFSLKAAPSR